MIDRIWQWMGAPNAPRTMLLTGTVGSGKSTLLAQAPDFFPGLPVIRLPAHLSMHMLGPQMDWSASLELRKRVESPGLEGRFQDSLVLLDDAHRCEQTLLSVLLRRFESMRGKGVFIASCLEPGLLGENLADRFAWSFALPKDGLRMDVSRHGNYEMPPLGHWPEHIAMECARQGYRGHRPEIAWMQAAAFCAAESKSAIDPSHIEQARSIALAHRVPHCPRKEQEHPASPQPSGAAASHAGTGGSSTQKRNMPPLRPFTGTIDIGPLLETLRAQGLPGRARIKASKKTTGSEARSIGARPGNGRQDIHLGATLRQAIPWQGIRGRQPGQALRIQPEDCRQHIRQYRQGKSYILVIDASGSMHAQKRIACAKALFALLLAHAYPRKEKVALLIFCNERLNMPLPLGTRWTQAQRILDDLQCEGKSPLHILWSECTLYARRLSHMPHVGIPNWIVLSDFHPNASQPGQGTGIKAMLDAAAQFALTGQPVVLLDAEEGAVRLGLARQTARVLDAPCLSLSQLTEKNR